MIRIGPKARIQGARPELGFLNLVLLGILAKHDAVMIITHVIDGVHSRASIHYSGCAEDAVFASTLDMTVKQQIFDELKASVGQDFDVIFEEPGKPNEHIHAEYQPKESY
jgi:hypothetical protein